MAHWTHAYVGLEYVPGAFDCGTLVETVQREVFGRNVSLPSERPYTAAETAPDKFEARAAQIQAEVSNFVTPTATPAEGDVVLMWAKGYLQHIGVCCVVQGELWVLHAASKTMRTVLQRASMLEGRGLRIEGYYKWK
jgi:hypothetical protein